MNISAQIERMYNEFIQDSSKSYETKSLLTNCYENIQKSLKIFSMLSEYPDLHRKIATYTYDSNGILISKKVNEDKNSRVAEYFKPTFDRGEDAMEVILHIFKSDNGVMVFANPPFVSIGTMTKTEFWINDRLHDVLEDDTFCKEIKDKIYDKINKCKNEVRERNKKD